MELPDSISRWLVLASAGDESAAEAIWNGYCTRLIALARKKLPNAMRRDADEEDVVVNVFDSFFRGAREGRFAQLNDRHDLWQILAMLTVRKAARHVERRGRLKRGGGTVRGESALLAPDAGLQHRIEEVVSREPTPEAAASMVEEMRLRFEQLGDDSLRNVAQWRMEGHTNREIAEKLGCQERTVERKLRLIRRLWNEGEPDHE